jgi:hypothetical protein
MDLRTATIKLQALTLRSSADRLRKVSRASLMGVRVIKAQREIQELRERLVLKEHKAQWG